MHDSRGIEIVNFTTAAALSAGTLMASAGTPYRSAGVAAPAHFYPWVEGSFHTKTSYFRPVVSTQYRLVTDGRPHDNTVCTETAFQYFLIVICHQ